MSWKELLMNFDHTVTFLTSIYYRLKVVSIGGDFFYSDIISPATRDLNGVLYISFADH